MRAVARDGASGTEVRAAARAAAAAEVVVMMGASGERNGPSRGPLSRSRPAHLVRPFPRTLKGETVRDGAPCTPGCELTCSRAAESHWLTSAGFRANLPSDRDASAGSCHKRSSRLRPMDYFIFGYTFMVASCESRNGAYSGSVAKMIHGADASWAGTRVTHGNARRSHSADHQAEFHSRSSPKADPAMVLH